MTTDRTTLPQIVEICCPSPEAAFCAYRMGADRIELCSDLEKDGLTPSHEDILSVGKAVITGERPMRMNVLIRPREGDFVYSEGEKREILEDIEFCASSGVVESVVIGALTREGDIDIPFCKEALSLARSLGLGVTFHRAIDHCRDILSATAQVLGLGVDRILSSGGAPTAWEGKRNLCMATYISSKVKTIVMPGSGVTPENVAPLLDFTLAREVHGSRISLIQAVSDYYNGRYVL